MMLRISRWCIAVLPVLFLVLTPAASSAQLGGLKKKMKDKISGDPQPAATPASTAPADADEKARQDAWQHPAPITSSALDGFAKAMKTENAERAKFLASAPPSSALAKWNAYQAAKAECASEQEKIDSTQARLQRTMLAEVNAGHPEKIPVYSDSMQKMGAATLARNQRCSSLARPQLVDEDYKAVHAEEAREEAAAATAAGMSAPAYARFKERVIAYLMLPSSWKPEGYSPDELRAIDARRAELRALLGKEYNTSGQRNPVGT